MRFPFQGLIIFAVVASSVALRIAHVQLAVNVFGLARLGPSRTSAPHLPQTLQVKRSSISDSLASSGQASPLIAIEWLFEKRQPCWLVTSHRHC